MILRGRWDSSRRHQTIVPTTLDKGNVKLSPRGVTFQNACGYRHSFTFDTHGFRFVDDHVSPEPLQGIRVDEAGVIEEEYYAAVGAVLQRAMLHDLLGVLAGELLVSALLAEFGVDLLMSTKALLEINKRLGVRVSNVELAEIPDVRGLVHYIFPGPLVVHAKTHSKPAIAIDISINNQPQVAPSRSALIDPLSCWVAEIAASLFYSTWDRSIQSNYTTLSGVCNQVYPEQIHPVMAYAIEGLEALAPLLQPLELGGMVLRLKVPAQHEKVLNRLYDVLEFSRFLAKRMYKALRAAAVECTLRVVKDEEHVFDESAWNAVVDGYQLLRSHIDNVCMFADFLI
ncbi:hypothetical protein BJY00DRAFT_319482 [Aspergillus carlsbadensis]|nr:hypothetical protein BJY00DRAFT_319482 [Aspergillus carlsbadensis]